MKNFLDKTLMNVPDRLDEVGGCDPPRKIEMSRHSMTERDVVEFLADNLRKLDLLSGVAGGKFTDDPRMMDPLGTEAIPHLEGLFPVDTGYFDAAVIDAARQEVSVLVDVIMARGKAGSADHRHSDSVDLVLNDGIGGDRGAQHDPFQLTHIGFIDQFVGHRQK